jgi:hypothetical protein
MAEVLLVTPSEITATTIMGGDVDLDKYRYTIFNTQIMTLEPLLGTELYDKMINDFTVPQTYAGVYNTLYVDYIKPILKYKSVAEYISIANYMLTNGGLLKHTSDNNEIPTIGEVETLSGKYDSIAQMYIERFDKWICNNSSSIPEYKLSQDDVNAKSDLNTTGGWYL